MDLSQLKAQIKNKQFQPLYIFTGDEWKVQDIYIDQMERAIGKKAVCDSVSDIIPLLGTKLFNSGRCLYVVRDDMDFIGNEKLQNRLAEVIRDNVVILRVSRPDKRARFYKMNTGSLVDFMALETAVLRRYVKKAAALSDRNADILMALCENNYGRCLLEIDKVQHYMRSAGSTTFDKAFQHLVDNGVIYDPPYDAIFDFVDEVIRGNVNTAFDLLKQCREIGEANMVMLSVLYTSTKQVLQVQSCESKDVAKTTGLTAWQIQKAKEKTGYRTIGELVYMLKLIRKIEKGIKTGEIEEAIALDYLLVNIL